ncbi:MAG: nitronate monooxygenase, partial [Mycobacterium sp.]
MTAANHYSPYLPKDTGASVDRDLLWGVTPFGQPSAPLVVALSRAGAFGVLDTGKAADVALSALHSAAAGVGANNDATFGVRVSDLDVVAPGELPTCVSTVVVAAGSAPLDERLARWKPRRVVVEVLSLEEAVLAQRAGADGLIARGSECGGRLGDVGAFVLLQQLTPRFDIPVWCQGGVGLHTAAAAVAGGAAGVVLDTQLALVKELQLPALVRAAISSMDGAETAVVGGHRVFVRPDLATAPAHAGPDEVAARLGVELPDSLLPAGQDTAFAAGLARRFHTAGGVVHAVRTAMRRQIRSAATHKVLEPGSAFAQAFGLRYP